METPHDTVWMRNERKRTTTDGSIMFANKEYCETPVQKDSTNSSYTGNSYQQFTDSQPNWHDQID